MARTRSTAANAAQNGHAEDGQALAARLEAALMALRERAEQAERDRAEALEQQRVTSEILRVISASPADLQPALNAIATQAARVIFRRDGEVAQLLSISPHTAELQALDEHLHREPPRIDAT